MEGLSYLKSMSYRKGLFFFHVLYSDVCQSLGPSERGERTTIPSLIRSCSRSVSSCSSSILAVTELGTAQDN